MNFYFNKVLIAIHQEACYSKLGEYESKILNSAEKLMNYYKNRGTELGNVYKQEFIDSCSAG